VDEKAQSSGLISIFAGREDIRNTNTMSHSAYKNKITN
jgi:hypothetical protein